VRRCVSDPFLSRVGFRQMSDPLLVERMHDVQDIERRLLRQILGDTREDLAHLTKPIELRTEEALEASS